MFEILCVHFLFFQVMGLIKFIWSLSLINHISLHIYQNYCHWVKEVACLLNIHLYFYHLVSVRYDCCKFTVPCLCKQRYIELYKSSVSNLIFFPNLFHFRIHSFKLQLSHHLLFSLSHPKRCLHSL